jgi:peptide deformylase
MALLPILRFPDARLKKVAVPIASIDGSIRKLAADMAETMYEAPGIGLAATQVDVHKQLVVIDISEEKNDLLVLVNPRIAASDGGQTGERAVFPSPASMKRSNGRACHRRLSRSRWQEMFVEGRWLGCLHPA